MSFIDRRLGLRDTERGRVRMSSFVASKKEQHLTGSILEEIRAASPRSVPDCSDKDSDVELGNVETEKTNSRSQRSLLWYFLSPEEQADWNKVAEWLKCDPSEGVWRKKQFQNILKVKNEEGISLLSVAVESKAPLEVLQFLLEKHKENEHLYDANVLTKIIRHYLVPLIRGSFNGESEAHQQMIAQEWMNKYLAKPLSCYILDASTALRKVLTLDGETIQVPQDVYPYISKSVTSSTELQELVNRQTIKRSVLSILFLDLYAHIAVITLFCKYVHLYLDDIQEYRSRAIDTTSQILNGGAEKKYTIGLLILVGYFFGRLFVETMSTGIFWGYHFDRWYIFELSKIVLLLVTVVLMGEDNLDDILQAKFQHIITLMVVTTGLLFLSFILSLRNTFLPFSNFVTGTLQIMKALVPFFVITAIILVAFMNMYYAKRFDDGYVRGSEDNVTECNTPDLIWNMVTRDGSSEKGPKEDACTCEIDEPANFCTYRDSFYNVFGYLAGGPDETIDLLDVTFIFLTVIIFLNVLIAIVANAWDKATKERIHEAFWTYRLTYFGKIGVFSRFYRGWEIKLIEVLRLQGIRKRLARSLSSNRKEEQAVEGFANKFRVLVQQGVRFFVKFIIFLPLGVVTFGFFWTEDIRKFFFYNHSDTALDEFEMLRKETESLKEEQMAFVREENRELIAQMASVREDNLKLVDLQENQSEKIADMSQKIADMSQKQADMSQKQAEDMRLLIETCQRNRSDLS